MRSLKPLVLGAVCAAALMSPAILSPAWAQEGPSLIGTWSGQIEALGAPAAFTLTVEKTQGSARWGGKAQCETRHEAAGTRDGVLLFTVTGSGGGYCDRFWNKTLEVAPAGDGKATATFLDGPGKPPLLRADLKRDGGAP